jgi:hypothetical protein
LAIAAAAASAAEPLGRLFYAPAQRMQLDAARSQKSRPSIAAEPEAPTLPEVVTYDGVVRRSDGRNTVWLNNRAVHDGRTPADVPVSGKVRADGSVTLGLPQSDRSVKLKVGQSVEIMSGSIAEPYSRAHRAGKFSQESPPYSEQSVPATTPPASRAAPAPHGDLDAKSAGSR